MARRSKTRRRHKRLRRRDPRKLPPKNSLATSHPLRRKEADAEAE